MTRKNGYRQRSNSAKIFRKLTCLRNNRIYGPLYDALDVKTYRLPGRDLAPNTQFQFVEQEYMKEDEYDDLINDPPGFMIDIWLPRILGELGNRGTGRSYIAMLKGWFRSNDDGWRNEEPRHGSRATMRHAATNGRVLSCAFRRTGRRDARHDRRLSGHVPPAGQSSWPHAMSSCRKWLIRPLRWQIR